MEHLDRTTLDALEEADVLKVFSRFCEKNSSPACVQKLRTIYSRTSDPLNTTKIIASRDYHSELSNEGVQRLYELIKAFSRKTAFRRTITEREKRELLALQNYRCAFCDCQIDTHAHADHIVPFKYVGDELEDNLQMLCSKCNTKKNADIFYQIKHLLGMD